MSYTDFTLPRLQHTDVATAHQPGEVTAITLTRAVAALLSIESTPPRHVTFAGRPTAAARFAFTIDDEHRSARLCWTRDRFGLFVDDGSRDLATLRLDRCRQLLAAAIDTDSPGTLAALQQHRCAELLAAGITRSVRHERILFGPEDCAGCGQLRYQVRARDRLCRWCRGERLPLPEPAETLDEAQQRGIIPFLEACYPRRLAELQRRERDGHQLALFTPPPAARRRTRRRGQATS